MADPVRSERIAQVRGALVDLRVARLSALAWPAVAGDLARLNAALERGDDQAVEHALLPVAQIAYEGKVRRRLAAAGGRAAMVSATKPTSSLPLVGAGCGALLCVLGYQLGGGLVLVGTALFGLFIFGVAVAGTRTNAQRTEDRMARRASPTREVLEPAPPAVVVAMQRLEVTLGA